MINCFFFYLSLLALASLSYKICYLSYSSEKRTRKVPHHFFPSVYSLPSDLSHRKSSCFFLNRTFTRCNLGIVVFKMIAVKSCTVRYFLQISIKSPRFHKQNSTKRHYRFSWRRGFESRFTNMPVKMVNIRHTSEVQHASILYYYCVIFRHTMCKELS